LLDIEYYLQLRCPVYVFETDCRARTDGADREQTRCTVYSVICEHQLVFPTWQGGGRFALPSDMKYYNLLVVSVEGEDLKRHG